MQFEATVPKAIFMENADIVFARVVNAPPWNDQVEVTWMNSKVSCNGRKCLAIGGRKN